MNKETLATLRRLGLNQYESKTYLALCNTDSSTATELSDAAGIPRPRVYDVLDKLEKKGFVITRPGRPTRYNAVAPSTAVFSLKKEKESAHKKEVDELGKLEKQLISFIDSEKVAPSGVEEVFMLRERKNIYSTLRDLITNAEASVILSSHKEGLNRKRQEYGSLLQKAQKRGVEVNLVESAHRFAVIDNHALMFLSDSKEAKNDKAAWIQSEYVANSLREKLK